MTFGVAERWLDSSPRALQEAMDRGERVRAAQLAGAWYRGTSLGLWGWVERLAWKTFAKTFQAMPNGVMGWNVRLHQDGLAAPPRPQERRGKPKIFGFYAAVDQELGLELDYGIAPNPVLDPTRRVRDPLVSLDGERVLLGRTWVAVGRLRVPTPSFFLLERAGPIPADVVAAAVASGFRAD